MPEVSFTQEQMVAFARLSHDVNPLHVDPDHARRTPFGECVVQGILGVLVALDEALPHGAELVRLRARFVKPLFAGRAYTVDVATPSSDRATVVVSSAGGPRLHVDVEHRPRDREASRPRGPGHAERLEPLDQPVSEGATTSGLYELAWDRLSELERALGRDLTFLSEPELTALLFSSYLVGMELPGRQALFTSLSLELEEADAGAVRYEARVQGWQPATSTLAISAKLAREGREVARLELSAARRPPSCETSLADLEPVTGRSTALAGKVALVSGSSRGLGSLIALACALHGADVVLHCRAGVREAERISGLVASLGRRAAIVRGEIDARETWLQALEAARSLGGLDVFVLNASPPLVPMPFAEVSEDVVEDFVGKIVRAGFVALREVVPALVSRKGCVVNVSSQAVSRPPRDFTHYVAAKAALEGLIASLAVEQRAVRFVTARPPRLLTDMTNGIVPAFQGRRPEGVAASITGAIVNALSRPTGENHVVIEGFDR